MQPVYALGWTLNYEMFFYVLFAIALIFRFGRGVPLLLLTFCVAIFCGQFVQSSGAVVEDMVYSWTRPIIGFFMLGAILGLTHKYIAAAPWVPRFRFVGLSILITGVFFVAISTYFFAPRSYALAFLSTALLVLCASIPDIDEQDVSFLRSFARLLGDASYSIYLTHSFLVGPLARIYGALGLQEPMAFIFVSLIGASLLGILIYRHVEQPMIRFINRKLHG